MSIKKFNCKLLLLQLTLTLTFYLPTYSNSAPDKNNDAFTENELLELQSINKQLWDIINLSQLFNRDSLDQPLVNNDGNAGDAESTTNNSIENRSTLDTLCFKCVKNSKHSQIYACIWCWCCCIAIPLTLAYPELDYCYCYKDCYKDCHSKVCCETYKASKAEPIETQPIEIQKGINFSLWLKNHNINQALIISNPSIYQHLAGSVCKSHRITSMMQEEARRLSAYQIAIIDWAEHNDLFLSHIRPDSNCFRNVFLSAEDIYTQSAVDEIIDQLNKIIILAIRLSCENDTSNFLNNLLIYSREIENGLREIENEEILQSNNPLPKNIPIYDLYQFIQNTQSYITVDTLNEALNTNRNEIHADISLAIFMPLITNTPVLIIQNNGNNEVGQFIVNQKGNRYYTGSDGFTEQLQQSIIIIHNGNNHYLTAERRTAEAAVSMQY